MNILGSMIIALAAVSTAGGHPADPLALVHRWDAGRAAAYRAGDPAALRALYARDSTAGRADVATLRAYERRGIRVTVLTAQVFAARVLARRHSLVRVRLTGRVGAVGDDGHRCVRLPTSPIRTRDLTLHRAGDRWVMASVRPAGLSRWPPGRSRAPR